MATVTITEILDDLRAADEITRRFERRYWLSSADFYELYSQGLLSSAFPHHLHEPPNIKHNRRPAPGISFAAPNLPTLIADCLELGGVQTLKVSENL